MERKKKNDLLLCGGLCLAALFCFMAFWLWKGGAGGSQGEREKRAVIQLDGKTVAEFLLAGEGELLFLDETYGVLDEEGNVTIYAKGQGHMEAGFNRFQLKEGGIACIEADCPDGICVKTGAVSHETETIVCLPHRLVLTVLLQQETGAEGLAAESAGFKKN